MFDEMTSSEFEKELAKSVGQIAVETARDFRSGLGKIFGPASAEFGAMLGEQMRYWRFKNLSSILEKMNEIRGENSSANSKQLPIGDAIRVIEAASYEEDETVQGLWAGLLLNATTLDSGVSAKKTYIDILKSLSSAEVLLLDLLWECDQVRAFRSPTEVNEFNERMNAFAETAWRKLPLQEREVATQNLLRLRCIAFRPRSLDFGQLFARIPQQDQYSHLMNKWSAIDPDRFLKGLDQILSLIHAVAGIKNHVDSSPIPLAWGPAGFGYSGPQITVREMNYMLTSLGSDLMNACRVRGGAIGGKSGS
jgi:hypothetical protein